DPRPKSRIRMVVLKRPQTKMSYRTYLNVRAKHRRLRFPFQYLQCQRPKACAFTAQKLLSPSGDKTARRDNLNLVIEESGAYTAYFFGVKLFFLQKKFS
ncbi:MAG: hypothetical protein ACXU8O_01815, partial [Asticcacaulis sp.]